MGPLPYTGLLIYFLSADGSRHDTRRNVMAKGDKDKYTDKQKRKAEHIEESYEDRGVSQEEAERRA